MIDDEASEYGITIVKSTDKLMAKKYGYRKLPGLTYFRKGIVARQLLPSPQVTKIRSKSYICPNSRTYGVDSPHLGKNINYDGDIDDEEEVLDWLTLPDNMEMTDHIERVNRKMFQKIRQTSDYLAVFLCKLLFFFQSSTHTYTRARAVKKIAVLCGNYSQYTDTIGIARCCFF